MLFAAVALTGVLASVGMQTLTGPVTTITRVTQKNIADTQLLMNAKIIINAAVSGTLGGDSDSDGIIEPAAFVAAGGGETPPTNGGYLPTTLGLSLTDPWGSKYGYCVWDHGTTNSSTGRIGGDNTAGATTQPVIAVIASGPDKQFQTTCAAYSTGPIAVAKAGGSDDLIFKYTYAEASANSNGLWTLNTSDQTKAELKNSAGNAVNVRIDRDTGIGTFLGITTDTIVATTDKVTLDGGLKLDTNANVTACTVADAGVIRYNTTTLKLEICTGTVWKAAGSDLWLENGNDIYSGNTGNVGIGTNAPGQKLDVQGNTNISGNTTIGGTGAVVGNFTVNTDAFSVIAASKYVGIGKAVPTVALDVVGNAYVTGTGTIVDDLVVDTSSLFVDASANTVGVGTATPTYALDIYAVKTIGALGSLDTNNAVVRIKEDTSGPSLFMDGNTVVSDAAFIVGSTGNADVSIVANALEAVRVAAGGNVGIGVTSPAVKLDVAGGAQLTDGSSLQFGGTDTLITGNSSTDVLTFSTAATERVRIGATGNVGIGDNNPAAKLSVAGGVKIGAHTTCGAGENGTIRYDSGLKVMQLCVDGTWKSVSSIDKLDDIGDVDAPTPAGNEVLAWDTVSSKWMAKPISALGPASVTPAGSDGSIQFKDGSNLGADATTFHWDKTNDRLGIGTNAPDTDLHIKRGAGNTVIKMESGSGYGTISHTGANFDITNSATGGDMNVYTADELSFWTGTPSTRRLYIGADGKTGIGTATPGALLDVEGGIQLGDDAGTCDAGKEGTLRFNTSQLQICVSGTWTPVGTGGGGGGGLGTSMVSGWPDAVNCGATGNPSLYYLTYAPFSDTKYYYRNIWHGGDISVIFKNDKTYDSKTTADTGCDNKSITQLFAENRAFNFVGGGTAGAGTSIVTSVPDAIECGVSGTKRILYLQTSTAATHTYALSGGATAVGMQVVYDVAGTHNSTTNTAGWTNANGCDGKTLAQLASETRTFDLVGGTGGGSGITVAGASGYIQFNTSGALDGESALIWDKTNNYLGVALSGAPLATIDVAGGVKLGTDATCTAGKAGMLVYNAGSLQFCNSSGTFVPVATGSISLANGAAGRVQLSDGSGNFTSDSGLIFSSGKLGVGGAAGSDTLGVTGTASISSNATVGGTLGVTGNTTLGGTLGVTGAATLSSATVSGDLTVDGTTLVVSSSGNKVGIGSATPVAMLDVAGGIRLGNDAGTCDNTREGTLRFNADNLEVCKSSGWGLIQGGGSGTLWTVVGNDAYSSNTGNIGIGTTTPASKLDVNGGIRLGDDAGTCVLAKVGTLRFQTGKMQICNAAIDNSYEWQDLATVSGVSPTPPDTDPFTNTWPEAISCVTGAETRIYYARYTATVENVRYYYERNNNYYLRFNEDGSFSHANQPSTDCYGKSISQLATLNKNFSFKTGTAGSLISGWPDTIQCYYNSNQYRVGYLNYKDASRVRYYDPNGYYEDFDPNTRMNFTGNLGTSCDNVSIDSLVSGGRAYSMVGGTQDKTAFIDGYPDVIICTATNGDQYVLGRWLQYTDTSNVAEYKEIGTGGNYYQFRMDNRYYNTDNFNSDCRNKTIDELRDEGKAFNWVENGFNPTNANSGTSPSTTPGTPLIAGWPDTIYCEAPGGLNYLLYYQWKASGPTGMRNYRTADGQNYIQFTSTKGFNAANANIQATDCNASSLDTLESAGKTKNWKSGGAEASRVTGWPDAIRCNYNSGTADLTFHYSHRTASTVVYGYWYGGQHVTFNTNGTWNGSSYTTDCNGKSIGTLVAETGRTFNWGGGTDSGSMYVRVPDILMCQNSNGDMLPWYVAQNAITSGSGLYYYNMEGGYFYFNYDNGSYTWNTNSGISMNADCQNKSLAQMNIEGKAVFLNDTNNANQVPGKYTPSGSSVVDGWPDAILCRTSDNRPWVFRYVYQGTATTVYHALGDGYSVTYHYVYFDNNRAYQSSSLTSDCNGKSIAQLEEYGQTFNFLGGGGGSGGGTAAGVTGNIQFKSGTTLAADSELFWNSTTKRMGVGGNNPVVKLDVAGGVKLGNETATCAAPTAGTIRWNGTQLQLCDGTAWAQVGTGGGGGTPGGASGQMQFNDGGAFAGASNVTYDKVNGRLGIGTTTPGASLHSVTADAIDFAGRGIYSDMYTVNAPNSSSVNVRRARGTPAAPLPILAGDKIGGLQLSGHDGTTFAGGASIQAFAEQNFSGTVRDTYLTLLTNSGAVLTERMRITSAGLVGIGTTTPQAALDVNGGVRLGTTNTCAVGGANNGTLRYDSGGSGNVQVCVNGSWSNLAAGAGGGSGSSMWAGWPDSIICRASDGNWATMYISWKQPTSNNVYYSLPWGASYGIYYNNTTGAYISQSNMGTYDCATNAWSIQTVNSMGRSFNFVGGSAGAGGSNPEGTNASMYSGWPDSVMCVNGSTDRRILHFANRNETTGAVTYRQIFDSSDVSLTYASAGTLSANTGMSGYDCVANTSFDSINELYSQSRAFNLASATAVSSGPVGAMQFSATGQTLGSDSANLFWDNTNKRLGIGTASPAAALTVKGSAAGIAEIGQWTGSTVYGAIYLNGAFSNSSNYNILSSPSDLHLYLNRPSGYDIKFREANADNMIIKTGGNVGIGTISPLSRLHVVGGGVITGTDASCSVAKAGMLAWNSNTLQLCTNTGSFVSIASASGTAVAAAGSNTQLQFNNSGVLGASNLLTWDSANFRLSTPFIVMDTTSPTIYTGTAGGELNRYLNLINSPASQSASGLKAGGVLISDTYAYANPGKNDLVVKGNVGIGVPSPVNPLEIAPTTQYGPAISIAASTHSTSERAAISFGSWQVGQDGGGTGTRDFYIYDNVNAPIGHRLYITTAGDIGVGTTTPQAKLDVAGGIRLGNHTACAAGNAGTLRWTGAAIEVCNGGSWISVGSGGGGTGGSVIAGWPDMLYCLYSGADMMQLYPSYRYADGRMQYYYLHGTYYITFNGDGTYNTGNMPTSGTNYCQTKTIAQLYAAGQAFNFVGGGGTNGGSSGTNQSMISGWPDVVRCDVSGNGERLFYIGGAPTGSSTYVYREIWHNSDLLLSFNSSGVITGFSYGGPTSTACAVGQTISTLYSSGRAFNLAASTAIASGTAGALQFSAGQNLNSDVANLFWDNTNKRLGIGVAAPAAPLHVMTAGWTSGHGQPTINVGGNGDVLLNTQGVLFFDNNYSYSLGSYIGPYSNTSAAYDANTIKVTTAGAERMRVNSSGNVGIGVLAPLTRLHVVGGGVITGTDATCNASKAGMLAWNSNTLQVCTNSGSFVNIATSAGLPINAAGANGQIQFNNGGVMGANASFLWDNSNMRMAIGTTANNAHRVNIVGNTTTVYANAAPDLTLGSVLGIANITASELANSQAQIQFNVNGGTYNRVGSIGMIADANNSRMASLVFTTDDGAGRTEKMRINAAGNVGIGTTTPITALHVAGATGALTGVNIGTLGAAAADQSALYFTTLNGATGRPGIAGSKGWVFAGRGNAYGGSAASYNDMILWYADGTTWATNPAMKVDSISNSISMGHPESYEPQAQLDVNGGIKIGNTTTCAAGNAGTLRWNGTGVEVCNGGSWISVGSGGGGTGGTMLAGFPDAIVCSYAADPSYLTLYLNSNNPTGNAYYTYINSPASYNVTFNLSGAISAKAGVGTGSKPCNVGSTLASMYTNGQAFNFVGGGGTNGGSAGTNASIVSGWPDALSCTGANGSVVLNYAWKNAAGAVSYSNAGDYGTQAAGTIVRVDFANATAASTLTEGTGWTGWATDCGSKTIATLYSGGQAFNLAASSALASGTAGAVQFSGGQNLANDSANLFWDNTNKRFGIGTATPLSRMHVQLTGTGGISLGAYNSPTTDNIIRFVGVTGADGTWNGGNITGGDNGSAGMAIINSGDGSGDSNDVAFYSHLNGSQSAMKMMIKGSGAIGINTMTPQARLDVNGGIRTGTDAACTAAKAGMLAWNSNTLQVCTNSGSFVSIATASGLQGAAGATGNIQFNISSAMSADNNLFWDNTNKWMGLGTTTPAARLTVNGSQNTTQTTFTQNLGSAGILIDTAYTANAYTPGIFWRTSDNNPTKPKAGIYLKEDGTGTYMHLGTSNSYAAGIVYNVVVDPNGRIGVGTATPAYPIDVVGNVRATAYLNTSDRTLKDNIETAKGLEIIRKLRGVSFVWKETRKEALGLIAQEVEEVVPQAVITDDKGIKSVDYIMMISPMIEAIKSLDVEVVRLTKENADLKARVETLEGTVKTLEERLKAIEEKIGATVH